MQINIIGNTYDCIQVKKYSYCHGAMKVICYNNKNAHLIIGSFVSIAMDCTFLLAANTNHNKEAISTFPFGWYFFNIFPDDVVSNPMNIVVGDDVWIGYGATICSGVNIGQGAIIGTGAVVTRSSLCNSWWQSCKDYKI
jgi:acetyltransferase-like isoleucine patch superfamily enzyme